MMKSHNLSNRRKAEQKQSDAFYSASPQNREHGQNVGEDCKTVLTVADALSAKRRELISQPLDRIWPDLARTAIAAMREPTVSMVAAAFPCEANEAFSHEDMCLGAAVCLKLGGTADVGLLEGEAVKQAAFLARDYRLMIDAALSEVQP